MRIPILTLAALTMGIVGPHAAPNLQVGRELAIDACSACHQVTADQKPPRTVFDHDENVDIFAPTFQAIAEKYARRPSALRLFILNPIHPMPEQNWDPDDLTAVVNFIRSLRDASSSPRERP